MQTDTHTYRHRHQHICLSTYLYNVLVKVNTNNNTRKPLLYAITLLSPPEHKRDAPVFSFTSRNVNVKAKVTLTKGNSRGGLLLTFAALLSAPYFGKECLRAFILPHFCSSTSHHTRSAVCQSNDFLQLFSLSLSFYYSHSYSPFQARRLHGAA